MPLTVLRLGSADGDRYHYRRFRWKSSYFQIRFHRISPSFARIRHRLAARESGSSRLTSLFEFFILPSCLLRGRLWSILIWSFDCLPDKGVHFSFNELQGIGWSVSRVVSTFLLSEPCYEWFHSCDSWLVLIWTACESGGDLWALRLEQITLIGQGGGVAPCCLFIMGLTGNDGRIDLQTKRRIHRLRDRATEEGGRMRLERLQWWTSATGHILRPDWTRGGQVSPRDGGRGKVNCRAQHSSSDPPSIGGLVGDGTWESYVQQPAQVTEIHGVESANISYHPWSASYGTVLCVAFLFVVPCWSCHAASSAYCVSYLYITGGRRVRVRPVKVGRWEDRQRCSTTGRIDWIVRTDGWESACLAASTRIPWFMTAYCPRRWFTVATDHSIARPLTSDGPRPGRGRRAAGPPFLIGRPVASRAAYATHHCTPRPLIRLARFASAINAPNFCRNSKSRVWQIISRHAKRCLYFSFFQAVLLWSEVISCSTETRFGCKHGIL